MRGYLSLRAMAAVVAASSIFTAMPARTASAGAPVVPGTCATGFTATVCDTGTYSVPVLSLTAPGTEDIAFECFAVTEGVVAATGVESCYLKNSATGVTVASSLPNWLPGNVTTERGSSNQPVAGYSLCVQVGFFTLGGAKFLGAVNCYPV